MDRQGLDLITPLLRIFFRLIYAQFAWLYDFIAAVVSGKRWKSWVLSAEQFITGPDVLELGPGPGHLMVHLAQSGHNVTGIDSSRQMIALARKRLASQKCSGRLVRGQGQFPPFSSAAFQCVVATFPTAYILQVETLQHIHRILVPNGQLVILLSSWITDPSIRGRGLAWLYRFTGQTLPADLGIQKLLDPFQQAGFEPHPEWIKSSGSRLLLIVARKIA
jgi:ubiquinone/menaquinone biosynthesis C-methylase UbiE